MLDILSTFNADKLAKALGEKLKEIGSPLEQQALDAAVKALAEDEEKFFAFGNALADHLFDRFTAEVLPALLGALKDREDQGLKFLSENTIGFIPKEPKQ